MKKILLVLLTLLISVTMFSCSNANSSSSSAQTSSSSQTTQITSSSSTTSSTKSTEEVSLNVAVPGGAPTFSQVQIDMGKSSLPTWINVTTDLKTPTTLPAIFNDASYDIVFAPTNLGAKLYNGAVSNGKTPNYKYAATVTWGNLYLVSSTPTEEFNLSDINGQELTAFSSGSVVDIVMKLVLSKNNVEPSNVTYLSAVSDVAPICIKNQGKGYYLLAEPVLSKVKVALKDANLKVISLQNEFAKIDSAFADGFTQSGVFVSVNSIKNKNLAVNKYLDALRGSVTLINNDPKTSASYILEKAYLGEPGLPEAIIEASLPGCGIKYKTAKESKASLEALFSNNLALIGGVLPNEEFYAF